MSLRSDGGGLNLRGDETPKVAKLAILDTRTGVLKGYEGRFHCSEFKVETDSETTADFMKAVIEEVRISSDKEAVIAGTIEHQRHAPGKAEYDSWFQ